jgi:chemotaxis protein CheX
MTTEVSARDLHEVVETIWTVTLGLEVMGPLGSVPPPPEETWCGVINVAGAWSGLVKVSMSEALTRRAASAMFAAHESDLSIEELTDALGEITNMTGGSVKALLPGPSSLSLPSVVSGSRLAVGTPGGVLIREIAFQCEGSQICVQVLEGRQVAEPKP